MLYLLPDLHPLSPANTKASPYMHPLSRYMQRELAMSTTNLYRAISNYKDIHMLKFIDTITNAIKLALAVTALTLVLATLGGIVFGGLWCYHKVAVLTATPIQMPTFEAPKIKVEMPDFGIVEGLKKLDQELGELVFPEEKKPRPPIPRVLNDAEKEFLNSCRHSTHCTDTTEHNVNLFLDECGHSPRCANGSDHIDKLIPEVWPDCMHTSPACKDASDHWFFYSLEYRQRRARGERGTPPALPPIPKNVSFMASSYLDCGHEKFCTDRWIHCMMLEVDKCKHSPRCTIDDIQRVHSDEMLKECDHIDPCKDGPSHLNAYLNNRAYPTNGAFKRKGQ